MRQIPPVMRAALHSYLDAYDQEPTQALPDMDQAAMELRDQLASFGVDLTNPDDYYVVWAVITIVVRNQGWLATIGIPREQAAGTMYAALAAAKPERWSRS